MTGGVDERASEVPPSFFADARRHDPVAAARAVRETFLAEERALIADKNRDPEPSNQGDVLGIIGGQARVVHGAKCVGHGVCAVVCPVDAIELVFGSEKRGIDIPEVAPDFQTNVPGIFVAGELGGMGLIRNAVEQGRQAMNSVRQLVAQPRQPDQLPPAGVAVLHVVVHGRGDRFAVSQAEQLFGCGMHSSSPLRWPSRSRRRWCARASWDFEKLVVLSMS